MPQLQSIHPGSHNASQLRREAYRIEKLDRCVLDGCVQMFMFLCTTVQLIAVKIFSTFMANYIFFLMSGREKYIWTLWPMFDRSHAWNVI